MTTKTKQDPRRQKRRRPSRVGISELHDHDPLVRRLEHFGKYAAMLQGL